MTEPTEYADIKFTRHQGQAITVDHAPPRARIHLRVIADRYAYLHMPDDQTIVFADQVVYRITGWDAGALELELVEDWRPAPGIQPPLTDEEADEVKAKWKEKHSKLQAVHPVQVLNTKEPGPA